jgi:hypothetical protein
LKKSLSVGFEHSTPDSTLKSSTQPPSYLIFDENCASQNYLTNTFNDGFKKKKYWGPQKLKAQCYRPGCTASGPGLPLGQVQPWSFCDLKKRNVRTWARMRVKPKNASLIDGRIPWLKYHIAHPVFLKTALVRTYSFRRMKFFVYS